MKAAVVRRHGGPDAIEIVHNWPKPSPKPGQVLVKVASSSVNPIDTYVRAGAVGGAAGAAALPKVLGGDVAGVVEGNGGNGVDNGANGVAGLFARGDRVAALTPEYWATFPTGTQAEYAAVDAAALAKLPDGVDIATAGAVPLVALTAWQALHKAGPPRAGQRLLVLAAAGGVGHLAVQFGKALGLRVAGLSGPSNVAFVREGLGADVAVSYEDDWVARLLDMKEAPFDMVIDPLGLQDESMKLLAPSGTYSVVQNAGADQAKLKAAVAAHAAAGQGGAPAVATTLVQPDGKQLQDIFGLIAAGKVRLEVAKVLPLDALAEGHRLVESKHTRGKVVITIP